jgi:uncharacterized protein (TIGR00299 family) protein
MKILYYHCFAGISGDMNLAAMIDLGVPEDYLVCELQKLNIGGYKLEARKELKMGISGTLVDVILTDSKSLDFNSLNPRVFELDKGHSPGHSHETKKHITEVHQHEHRSYKEIKQLIQKSTLSEEVKKTSIDIFEKVAIAEAKIHNKTIDTVHFHEVGAVDSIVDIVGAAICYHYLKPDKVLCSTIELGGGFVKCAHGTFPVPAPATAEILKDIPVKIGTVQVETTTPTGAAILAALVDTFTDSSNLKIEKTSYGLGHRNMDIPNVLRVHLAEMVDSSTTEKAFILECNIDDMAPEHYDFLIEKLLDEGAQDVFLTPIVMKKSRPATKLSVLCSINDKAKFENILFLESTTLGIRCYEVSKTILERKTETVETHFGKIDVKIAFLNGEEIKFKPEYEQCKEAAKKFNVPLKKVMDEVTETLNSKRK